MNDVQLLALALIIVCILIAILTWKLAQLEKRIKAYEEPSLAIEEWVRQQEKKKKEEGRVSC